MTEADVDTLDAQTPETLADWWAILNQWEWPKELADPPPAPRGVNQADRGNTIMWEIVKRVGMKETMRAWNVRQLKIKTNEEFETWWGKRKR